MIEPVLQVPKPEWTVSGAELWQWWLEARQQTLSAAVPVAELEWFLQVCLGINRLSLRLGSIQTRRRIELPMTLSAVARLWQRRLQERLPVQYLAGETSWRRLSLRVGPGVLIPRPETECLIDLVLMAQQLKSDYQLHPPQEHWADLGTGSGAIALGLAQALPSALIHAVDCSEHALAVARDNAQHLNLADRIQFYQGSWFAPLEALKGQLDGIVANPPYIPSAMIPILQPEVAQHEPHLAFDGGSDGLACIRRLVSRAPEYLKLRGLWLVETMAGQADAVVDLLRQQGRYQDIQVYPDLAGIDRFILAYHSE